MHPAPIELHLRWQHRSYLELTTSAGHPSNESVNWFSRRLTASTTDERFFHQLAKALFTSYAAIKNVQPSYIVGDKAWLSRVYCTDVIAKIQVSRKLGALRHEPFTILENTKKNAFRL